jgi:hypothetical protein
MLRDLLIQATDVCAAWVGRELARDTVVDHTSKLADWKIGPRPVVECSKGATVNRNRALPT